MNRYGRQAHEHWAKWRPNQLSQIPDPDSFFTELGEAVETQIEALQIALAGDDPGGEDYLTKVGRLRMARFDAEGQVLREMVLLPRSRGTRKQRSRSIRTTRRTRSIRRTRVG